MMIETEGLGGAEVVLLQLSVELRDRGHRVHAIGPGAGTGWLSTNLRDRGFEWHPYHHRWALDPTCAIGLARTLRTVGADVVHSHEFAMALYGTLVTRLLNIPHVITMHGNAQHTKRARRRVALRWAFRHSRAAVAVSHATKRWLDDDLRLPPDRITVVPNGIPVRVGDRERVRVELGLAPDDCLILAVGSLIPRKGHLLLLRALDVLARTAERLPPWHVAIAGVGDERSRLEDFRAASNWGGRIHLLGPRDDVPDLQAAADIFAMPSLWEGLPMALLEAMLAGKAILASDVSGIPEAVTNEVHGILTPPGDQEAVATALGRLLSDAELRRRLGRTAQERARAEFTVRTMADAYERLYRWPPRRT